MDTALAALETELTTLVQTQLDATTDSIEDDIDTKWTSVVVAQEAAIEDFATRMELKEII